MNTKEKINQALKDALRSGDVLRKNTLRMVTAAIKQAEVDGRKELDEQAVLAILQKQIKSREETVEAARQAGRADLLAEAEAEIEILRSFLPEPLSADELRALAQQVITEVGASSLRDMGKVMGALLPRVAGRASSKEVSDLVRQLLSG
jgi:hypothetical protein